MCENRIEGGSSGEERAAGLGLWGLPEAREPGQVMKGKGKESRQVHSL